ncbi:MAG: hypothetical protein ACJ71S_06380 [Acidobacteriaceae bacterium]|jgi:hypothetical protein
MSTPATQQHHPFCDSKDAATCPCYMRRSPIPAPNEDPEREAIALLHTCPDCHAPMNVGCIAPMWTFATGKWEPYFVARHAHSRRVKIARKSRIMEQAAQEKTD